MGKWGIVDVTDCVTAVNALTSPTSPSPIDPSRVVITGGSAGGFTVLAALCASPNTFAAGTSSYGVSDLRKLTEDTHKFESRYLEKLVGGTVEEVPEVYKERSPVHKAEKIKAPLLVSPSGIMLSRSCTEVSSRTDLARRARRCRARLARARSTDGRRAVGVGQDRFGREVEGVFGDV